MYLFLGVLQFGFLFGFDVGLICWFGVVFYLGFISVLFGPYVVSIWVSFVFYVCFIWVLCGLDLGSIGFFMFGLIVGLIWVLGSFNVGFIWHRFGVLFVFDLVLNGFCLFYVGFISVLFGFALG